MMQLETLYLGPFVPVSEYHIIGMVNITGEYDQDIFQD